MLNVDLFSVLWMRQPLAFNLIYVSFRVKLHNFLFSYFLYIQFIYIYGRGWGDLINSKIIIAVSFILCTNSHQLSVLTGTFHLDDNVPRITPSIIHKHKQPPSLLLLLTTLLCSVPHSRWNPGSVLFVSRSQPGVCYIPSTPSDSRWVLPGRSYEWAGYFPQGWLVTLYHPLVTGCPGPTQVPICPQLEGECWVSHGVSTVMLQTQSHWSWGIHS